ncbi:uncharacterized protein LOC114915342 [Cajanus cajan]|uniref:uncharacterized protein LOC114915342 n=1 Tax=Cajanus cajan TaxID=3821 RepID=UPI0010FB78A4|nr:uncharacterized protein LOC114915342 [Cajanus cajan]
MEEVTSKAVDADAVDLTGSPPLGEAPQMAAMETTAEASKAVEVLETPSSEEPGAGVFGAEQGTSAATSATTKVRGEGPSSEVPTSTPAASAPSSGPSQGASRS